MIRHKLYPTTDEISVMRYALDAFADNEHDKGADGTSLDSWIINAGQILEDAERQAKPGAVQVEIIFPIYELAAVLSALMTYVFDEEDEFLIEQGVDVTVARALVKRIQGTPDVEVDL